MHEKEAQPCDAPRSLVSEPSGDNRRLSPMISTRLSCATPFFVLWQTRSFRCDPDLDMLVDVGRIVRRHVTSEHRLHRLLNLPKRSFHGSFGRRTEKEPALPYLEPLFYIPTNSNPAARDIAVLGGGVTGLTAAFELARTIHNARITVYEKSERLGGWVDSEVVKVDDGEIIFEWGARSFRPSLEGPGWATATLLGHLAEAELLRTNGITVPLLGAHKTAPASRNRFLYYPDHLVRMPSPSGNIFNTLAELIHSLRTEPIWKGVLKGLRSELRRPLRRAELRDESVGDFVSRRFGPEIADNFVSAIFHGIYAGDIYKMSLRTVLPALWHAEGRTLPDPVPGIIWDWLLRLPDGTVVRQYEDVKLKNLMLQKPQPLHLSATVEALKTMTFATWGTGMAELIRLLQASLKDRSNIQLKPNSEVTSISYDNSKVVIATNDETRKFDYVVTTLPPRVMKNAISTAAFDPVDKAVTVMVVNLYYRPPTSLPPEYEGFGYLIPRSAPMEQNPERALGVIFAHHSSGPSGKDAIQYRRRGDMLHPPEICKELVQHLSQQIAMLEASNFVEIEEFAQRQKQLRLEKLHFESLLDDYETGKVNVDEEIAIRVGQDTVEGMKLTVMLGGHWWDGWSMEDYPSEDEAIGMAKSLLHRHLNITAEPTIAKARLQHDCIPQYPVGYRDLMATIHNDMFKRFNGQLKFAGPFYQGGVGINDCIRGGTYAAMAIRDGWESDTGLEKYTKDEIWVSKTHSTRFDRDIRYADNPKYRQ